MMTMKTPPRGRPAWRAAAIAMAAALALGACGDRGGEWKESTVAGIRLSAPATFREEPLELPAAVRDRVEKAEVHHANAGAVEVRVSRAVYVPGVEASLDGAVQGSVDEVSRAPGISGFRHTTAPARVSGKPATRVSANFAMRGQAARLEGLTVADGRTLYQVQALFPASDRNEQIATRVLQSVALQP